MKNQPLKITIITVCYNSAATIRETIESVLSQDYTNIEYVVIDGGSTDGTLDIINSYSDKISIIISEPDQGMYDAMNKGVLNSKGDVIGILNSDDIFYSNATISKIATCFLSNNIIDAVFTGVGFSKSSEMTDSPQRLILSKNFKSWMLRLGWMPPHPGMFLKRQVYKMAGGYKLTFKIAADYEFMVRIILKNKISYLATDFITVIMRIGGISTRGLKSTHVISKEIVRSCLENNISTNYFLVSMRLPIKYVYEVIFGKYILNKCSD